MRKLAASGVVVGWLLVLSESHSVWAAGAALTSFEFYKLNLGPRFSHPTDRHPQGLFSFIPRCLWQPSLANSLLFFLPWLSLDQDECLMGTHDCSWQQFCVNTLGSFYCVNHTVLCAEGYILNAHRKCVGKLEPLPAAHVTAACSAPRQPIT